MKEAAKGLLVFVIACLALVCAGIVIRTLWESFLFGWRALG